MSLDVRAVVRALANDLQRVRAATAAFHAGKSADGAALAHALGVAGLLPHALASQQFLAALVAAGEGARAALFDAHARGDGWMKAPERGQSAARYLRPESFEGSLRELGRRAAIPPVWEEDYRQHLEDWQDYLDDAGDAPDYDEVVEAYARVAEALALPERHPVAAAGRRLPQIADASIAQIVKAHANARFSVWEQLRSRLPAGIDRALDAAGGEEVAGTAYAFSGSAAALRLDGDLWAELEPDGDVALVWNGEAATAPEVRDGAGHPRNFAVDAVGVGRLAMARGDVLRVGDLLVDLELGDVAKVPLLDPASVARVRADATVAARVLVACGTDARSLALAALGVPAENIVLLAPSEGVARAAECAVRDALAALGSTAALETDVYDDVEALVLRAEAAVARGGDPDPGEVVLEVGTLGAEAAALVGGLAGARGYRLGCADPAGARPPRTYLSPRHMVPEDPRDIALALFTAGAVPEALERLEQALAAGFTGGGVEVLREVAEALLTRCGGEAVDVSDLLVGVPEHARDEVSAAFTGLGESPGRVTVMEAAGRIGTAWGRLQGGA